MPVNYRKLARILAIDYGTKRCGIAVTDPMQMIATGLTTVHSKDILEFLKKYIEKEAIECFVVGEPKRMNNEPSQGHKFAEDFVKQLNKHFPFIKVERMDERFTSKMAFQTMIDSGLKKKARQNKELVDEISATIILQSYLMKKSNS